MEPLVRSLPIDKINPANTALLIIDMERDFIDVGAVLEPPGGRELVPAINRLITWARRLGASIIFKHEMHRDDKSDYGIESDHYATALLCMSDVFAYITTVDEISQLQPELLPLN